MKHPDNSANPAEHHTGDGDPAVTERSGADAPEAPRRVPPGPSSRDTEALAPGTLLGKFRIIRQLGSGGMGAVYEAAHTTIGRAVAIKVMNSALASESRAEERFLREAAAVSTLQHPNVVTVTDYGTEGGISYLVMELLRGEDLDALVKRAPHGLEPATVADVMLAVAAGVFAAHQAGIIHRDLKPQNIFLARTPLDEMVPKVVDFGISKRVDETSSSLTSKGAVIGTMHYLSPEQVLGKEVDARSDQYALGVILYECLTGRRPHEGETMFAIMRSIGEGALIRPRVRRPELPEALETIILRAMSLRPRDRFPSVYELGGALLPFASPKRKVAWADYFQSSGDPGAGPSFVGPSYAPTAPLPMGPTRARSAEARDDDAQSGVLAVSVTRSSEIVRRRSARWRWGGMALTAVALGGVIAAFMVQSGSPRPRPRPGAVHVGALPAGPDQAIDQPATTRGPSTRAAPTPSATTPQPAPAVIPPADGSDRSASGNGLVVPERPSLTMDPAKKVRRKPNRKLRKAAVEYIEDSPLLK
jgi:serine/threonine-protein kinase